MRRSLFIFLLFLTTVLSGLPKEISLNQFMIDQWDNASGLPQNSVLMTTQTRDGYLWMGTEEGFVRFDGLKFKLFDDSTLNIENHNSRFIVEDNSTSHIWVGTDGGGLVKLNYKTEEYEVFDTKSGMPDNIITMGVQDSNNVFYAGTAGAGVVLIHDDGRIDVIDKKNGLPDNNVKCVYRSENDVIYIATKNYLSKIGNGQAVTVLTLKSDLNVIFMRNSKSMLLGTASNGVVDYNPNTGEIKRFMPKVFSEKAVSSISSDKIGCIYVGTYNDGFYRICDDIFSKSNWIPNNYIVDIFEDREGSLWLGSRGYGLSRIKEGKFITYGSKNGLYEKVVFPVTESADGGMWFGAWAGALYKLKNNKLERYTYGENLTKYDTILTLFQELSGILWVGVYGKGVLKVDGNDTTLFSELDGLPENNISSVFKDSRGTLWAGGMSKGLAYKEGDFFKQFPGTESFNISSIMEDHYGSIWIATKRGAFKLKGNSLVKEFTNLEDVSTLSIYRASSNRLIFTSDNGLVVYSRDKGAIQIDRSKGIDVRTIFDVMEDNQGNIWLTSNKGIRFIEKEEFESFLDGKIEKVRPATYGYKDGLLTPECNGGTQPNIWKSSDGRIWIPTAEGAAVVNPSNIRLNTVVPPVHIVSVSADDKKFKFTDDSVLSFKPGTSTVYFEYTGLSYLFPDQVKFKYKLDGFDEKWKVAGTQRYTFYTNLEPGEYSFKVIAANNDNLWNREGDVLTFVIEPYFWQTWWFKTIVILLVIVLAVIWIKSKVTEIRSKEDLLNKTIESRTRNLRDIIGHVKTLSGTLADISKTISSNTGITAEKFNATYAMIDTASSTLSDVTTKLSGSRDDVLTMNSTLNTISSKADSSTTVLDVAVEAMARIEDSTIEVSNIVEVVDEIAFKTNLLSLNAAIEAARAGDAGKGFAVVADSVRELSMQTADAVEMIRKLTNETVARVTSGRNSVNNIVDFISELISEFRTISVRMNEIRFVIEKHVDEVGHVDGSLSDIRRITQENTTMVDNLYQVSIKLNGETSKLRKEVAKIQEDQ